MTALFAITRMELLRLVRSRTIMLPLLISAGMLLALFVDPRTDKVSADEIRFHTNQVSNMLQLLLGVLTVILGASSLSGKISDGTILMFVTRPLSRTTFIFGHVLSLWIFAAFWCLLWAAEVGLIMNYILGGTAFSIGFQGLALTVLPIMLLATISVASSTRGNRNGAIATTAALWFSAFYAIHVRMEDLPGNWKYVGDLAEAVYRAVPLQQLGSVRNSVVSREALTSAQFWAFVALATWVAVAAIGLATRRNLAK